MSKLASAGVSEEKHEAPRLEVSTGGNGGDTVFWDHGKDTLNNTQERFHVGKGDSRRRRESERDSNECVWKGREQTGKRRHPRTVERAGWVTLLKVKLKT